MRRTTSRIAQISVAVLFISASIASPSFAIEQHVDHHLHRSHRMAHRTQYHPLTVSRRQEREPVIAAAPDPYRGPAAIVTAPTAIAGTALGLPFRALGAIFPPRGDPRVNPLVLVGAPIHFAGQVAQFPFFVIGNAFGAAPMYEY